VGSCTTGPRAGGARTAARCTTTSAARAVIVGLPPTGRSARFDPLALAEANQRILGSNYGSVDPQRDIPRLVDRYMAGELDRDALISGRRSLDEAAEALDDLAAGRVLRTLLMTDGPPRGEHVHRD
jgi:Zn-dependent alcohol dehydrogenase